MCMCVYVYVYVKTVSQNTPMWALAQAIINSLLAKTSCSLYSYWRTLAYGFYADLCQDALWQDHYA